MTDRGDSDEFDEEELGLPTRKELFRHVESNPGIHFNQLKRDLEMETGVLQYHLRELERYDVLESEEYQGKRRVFVAHELDEEERAILAVLRYETTREILLYFLEEGPARNREIAEAVGVTPATISWHISKLVEEGVVEPVVEGRTTRYEVENASPCNCSSGIRRASSTAPSTGSSISGAEPHGSECGCAPLGAGGLLKGQ